MHILQQVATYGDGDDGKQPDHKDGLNMRVDIHPVGLTEGFLVLGDNINDLTESECNDCQVIAAKTERGKANDETRDGSSGRPAGHHDDEPEQRRKMRAVVELLREDSACVGAYLIEGGMPNRELSGDPVDEVQAYSESHVESRENDKKLKKAVDMSGRALKAGASSDCERDRPNAYERKLQTFS